MTPGEGYEPLAAYGHERLVKTTKVEVHEHLMGQEQHLAEPI